MFGVGLVTSALLGSLYYRMYTSTAKKREEAAANYKPVDPEQMYPNTGKKIDDEALKDIILGADRPKNA